MAISFSRPDPSSPAAVGSAAFPTSRRGFDQGEVRDFLRMVAAELARLQERERFLENELRTMQTRGMSAPGRLDEETVTTLLGEEAARVLSTARDASTQIRDRAEESATRLVKDAAEDAARIRESAMIEAATWSMRLVRIVKKFSLNCHVVVMQHVARLSNCFMAAIVC
jgi:DivIVA domain-containing protein